MTDSNAQLICRLYDTVFGRKADVSGLANWTNALDNGNLTARQVTDGFIASSESINTYAGLDNTAFVKALYTNTLHRTADTAGLNCWSASLNSGAINRSAVVLSFSESTEHVSNTAAMTGSDGKSLGILFA